MNGTSSVADPGVGATRARPGGIFHIAAWLSLLGVAAGIIIQMATESETTGELVGTVVYFASAALAAALGATAAVKGHRWAFVPMALGLVLGIGAGLLMWMIGTAY